MKKNLVWFGVAMIASLFVSCGTGQKAEIPEGSIMVNKENFPDENFRKYILEVIDSDSNGALFGEELEMEKMICAGKDISNLKGIEHFVHLKELNCSANQLTELDVSENTSLTYLNCYGNQLTELDVSMLTNLVRLKCDDNQISALDISQNSELEALDCNTNRLRELDIHNNLKMAYLYCYGNELKELDITQNTALRELDCFNNQITQLDISNVPMLLINLNIYCDAEVSFIGEIQSNILVEYQNVEEAIK